MLIDSWLQHYGLSPFETLDPSLVFQAQNNCMSRRRTLFSTARPYTGSHSHAEASEGNPKLLAQGGERYQ